MLNPYPTIAVTGATGILGGHVARILADVGVPQRLLVRDPDRAPRFDNAVVLPFSFSDTTASVDALTGVETLLMVSATENPERVVEHRSFVDSAREAGVGHIVYTSFIGAAPDATFTFARDHFETEEHIKSSGMDHTFLRDNLYLDFMPNLVGEDGVIRGPAGDGRAAVVARADVARLAAAVLRDPLPHKAKAYDVTGPEALTMTEIAEILSRGLDRTITFHDETIPEAYQSRSQWDAPEWQYDAWVSTYTAIAAGEMAAVSTVVEDVTGQRPQSLAEFLAAR